MSMRALFCVAAFFFAFVVNPAYIAGCMTEESEPEFGEAEMLELLDAANEQGRWELESDGKTYEIELSLMQAVGAAGPSNPEPGGGSYAPLTHVQRGSLWSMPVHACGTRSFTQSASACITTTEVPIVGELTIRELSPTPHVVVDAIEVEGRLWTDAARLLFAYVDLDFGESSLTLYSPDAVRFDLINVNAVSLGEEGADIAFQTDQSSR